MQGMAWLFFVLMALVLLFAYLAIRRQWFAPGITSAAAVVLTIILMVLTALGQGNSIIQAVIVGIIVGGMFSGAILGVAWYFHSSEIRQHYPDDELSQQTDESS